LEELTANPSWSHNNNLYISTILNLSTRSFHIVFHRISSVAALLESNPLAQVDTSFLTVEYMANVTRMTEGIFRKRNGGLLLLPLKSEKFDAIADKYIVKAVNCEAMSQK